MPAAEAFDVAYQKALQHVLTTSTAPAVLAEARGVLADRGWPPLQAEAIRTANS